MVSVFYPDAQVKYKMTMGLEPMDPADWIEIDEHYEEEIALRRQLVAEKRDIVIHSTPGVRAVLLYISMPTCQARVWQQDASTTNHTKCLTKCHRKGHTEHARCPACTVPLL
jgi:hypothetical protein